MNVDELVRRIARDADTSMDRVLRLVSWLNTNFEWAATDYQKRTVAEIIERRAGNCADHAKVLHALAQSAGVDVRWMKEINLQPENPRRQETAARFVQEMGPSASVFGLLHNDHVWLEVYDEELAEWVPADSTLNLFGVESWVHGRLGFGGRPTPGQEMLVPFVVLTFQPGVGPLEDRSEHYLIEAFNWCHHGRLAALPAWNLWTEQVRQLAALGTAAFRGEADLHQHFDQMRELLRAYEQLRAEFVPSI